MKISSRGLALFLAGAATLGLGMALAGPPQTQPAARWPQFRGPDGLGLATDGMPLPVHFGPQKNVLWKTSLPRGHSSPCIWDDRIFLTGFDAAAGKLETICLDRQTGHIRWSRSAPAEKIENVHQVNSPAVATPATDGQRVYVYFGSYGLLCYDLDGNEQWKKPLPQPQTAFGTGTSPVIAGEMLLLNRDFEPDPSLLALDRRTGRIVWKQVRNLASAGGPVDGYATPLLWRHDGVDEVLVHGKVRFTSYDLKDGKERWTVAITSSACPMPALGDGLVFVAAHGFGTVPGEVEDLPPFEAILKKCDRNGDGLIAEQEFPTELYLFRRLDAAGVPGADLPLKFIFGEIDANKDGKIDRGEWEAFLKTFREFSQHREVGLLAIRPGGHGDVTKTHVLWREQRALPEVPSALYYRGRVYMVRDGGIVSCVDGKTGRVLNRKRLPAGGAYFSSPVAGDGKVYFASKDGVVVVIAAGDTLQPLAENDLGEPVLATPALADGKVYVRTEQHLYAFGE